MLGIGVNGEALGDEDKGALDGATLGPNVGKAVGIDDAGAIVGIAVGNTEDGEKDGLCVGCAVASHETRPSSNRGKAGLELKTTSPEKKRSVLLPMHA